MNPIFQFDLHIHQLHFRTGKHLSEESWRHMMSKKVKQFAQGHTVTLKLSL